MAPIIRTEKLRKVYAVGKERVVALNNVDLSIEKGEFCCIVGQSGSGKSTLLNQLAGLEKPTSGKVYIGKHEISKMTENELAEFRQQHLGFIFQSYNLLPTMTAAENVALPLMFKGVDKKTRLARARKELKSMGLLGRANHLPTEMSGGQQQRVGIARAFVSSPKVIFADEPTGNLDSRTSKQVLYRMLEMSKNSGVTFVMVTHEPDLAECADRIVTILDGKVCSGSGMWSNGAVWSAAGYTGYAGTRAECLKKLYNELAAGRPVIVHLKNTTVSGVKRHANRTSTYEYHLTSSGWDAVNYPHIATSSTYGHWVCVAGISSTADPENLTESDFYALDPARVTANGRLAVTRLLDDTLWVENSPLKVLG